MNFASYQERARAAAALLAQQKAAAMGNRHLSPDGKAAEVDKAERNYQASIAALKAEASATLERERAALVDKMRAARASAAERERQLLGPEVALRLIEKRLSSLDGPGLLEALQGARDPWETAVIGALGQAMLPDDPGDIQAALVRQQFADLAGGADPEAQQLEAQQRALVGAEWQLSTLDPLAHAATVADSLGVRAEFVQV